MSESAEAAPRRLKGKNLRRNRAKSIPKHATVYGVSAGISQVRQAVKRNALNMSKIRINELARQLEVKSREVIDKLHELGIAENLTHSSSIDEDKAEQLRRYFGGES